MSSTTTLKPGLPKAAPQSGASSMKDMGAVMKEAIARLGAGADGKLVSGEVKAALSGKPAG